MRLVWQISDKIYIKMPERQKVGRQDMFHNIYKIEYQQMDMKAFMERYHFDWQDCEMVKAAARFLSEITDIETWVMEEDEGVVCVATLGKRYDEIAGIAADSGNLLLSYCMECLGMEFLSKGYEKINQTVHEKTGLWLSKYHFLGEEESAVMMKQMLQSEKKEHMVSVEWKNGMLSPLKSVIFSAKYQSQKESEGCHNCSACENITCSFRKIVEQKNKLYENVDNRKRSAKAYSYGVTAIFGGEQE